MENVLDILLDENNTDHIILMDDDGRKLTFEQIAVIPYKEKIYCILYPVGKIPGVAADRAVVFYIDEDDGAPCLTAEKDDATVCDIFEQYYDLIDKEIEEIIRRE